MLVEHDGRILSVAQWLGIRFSLNWLSLEDALSVNRIRFTGNFLSTHAEGPLRCTLFFETDIEVSRRHQKAMEYSTNGLTSLGSETTRCGEIAVVHTGRGNLQV